MISMNMPRIKRGSNAGWKPHESRKNPVRYRRFIAEEESWAIIHKDTDKLIGSIGLHNDARRNNSRLKCWDMFE